MNTTYSVPDEIKESVEEYVAYLIGLLPGWVAHLYVDFQAYAPAEGEGGTRATITADYPYRRVYLNIYPAWLNDRPETRRLTIVHEAVHVLNAPLKLFIEGAIRSAFGDDSQATRILKEGFRVANEAVTEDTALAILKAIGDADGRVDYEKKEQVTPEGARE